MSNLQLPVTIQQLFEKARENPNIGMNQAGRLMGRHCVARLRRAQAKRLKRGKRVYDAFGGVRMDKLPEDVRRDIGVL